MGVYLGEEMRWFVTFVMFPIARGELNHHRLNKFSVRFYVQASAKRKSLFGPSVDQGQQGGRKAFPFWQASQVVDGSAAVEGQKFCPKVNPCSQGMKDNENGHTEGEH